MGRSNPELFFLSDPPQRSRMFACKDERGVLFSGSTIFATSDANPPADRYEWFVDNFLYSRDVNISVPQEWVGRNIDVRVSILNYLPWGETSASFSHCLYQVVEGNFNTRQYKM